MFDVGMQPASYIIENFLFAYEVSCRKDESTGKFCDPSLLEWSQKGVMSMGVNETCSDCWLGVQALQLNNPLGYDEAFASDFASLKTSCGVGSKYPVTPVTLGTTTTQLNSSSPASTPTPICSGSYNLSQSDENCHSVAQTLQVSTYSLLMANGIDLYCQNFYSAIESGATLCVPARCPTYTWQAGDSCESLVLRHPDITVTQFLAWNPNFNSLCVNGVKFAGYEVCIGPPGGSDRPTTNTTTLPLPVTWTTTATPVPAPTNAARNSTARCGRWYTIGMGDVCSTVALANGLVVGDLYFLNPGLQTNCSNLELGVAYCVGAVGDIVTYPGHPTPTLSGLWATIHVPPVTFAPVDTRITTPTSHPGFIATTTPTLPTASGTRQGCATYRNYMVAQPDDASGSYTAALNSCGYLESTYNVTVAELRLWNPSLAQSGDCGLQPGLSYCVQTSSDTPGGNTSVAAMSGSPPART
jgi:hypothetical protein